MNLARFRHQQAERAIILDEATRKRRQRKALEALEKDNYQDDLPTLSVSDARIQLNRRFQQKFTINEDKNNAGALTGSTGEQREGSLSSSFSNASSFINAASATTGGGEEHGSRRKPVKVESKLRFRKNFATLLEEEVVF